MSGGRYNYAYRAVEAMANDMNTEGLSALQTALRLAFKAHLEVVAQAMHAVEWADSGDWAHETADQLMQNCLTPERVLDGLLQQEDARHARTNLVLMLALEMARKGGK